MTSTTITKANDLNHLKFTYYEIKGFLPASFISNKLNHNVKFANREKAIKILEDVLKEWEQREGFAYGAEVISNCIFEGSSNDIFREYRHQYVYRSKRSGLISIDEFKVVKHQIIFEE